MFQIPRAVPKSVRSGLVAFAKTPSKLELRLKTIGAISLLIDIYYSTCGWALILYLFLESSLFGVITLLPVMLLVLGIYT